IANGAVQIPEGAGAETQGAETLAIHSEGLHSRYVLGGRAPRRFAGTPLRCLVTDFVVSTASNNCRNPCANSSTAFPNAPSCPTRTIATARRWSIEGGRKTSRALKQ